MTAHLGPYELNTIITGDARELAKAIPDESVDLIFTDPVYDRMDDYRWLAETAAKVLKPSGNLLIYFGAMYLPETIMALTHDSLRYGWEIKERNLGTKTVVWARRIWVNLKSCLWYFKPPQFKGSPMPTDFYFSTPDGAAVNHPDGWSKNLSVLKPMLEVFSDANQIVFDPFTGGGTVPAVCKILGRNYLAFEIDPDIAERARQRVAQTQPPLFVLQPQQGEMQL